MDQKNIIVYVLLAMLAYVFLIKPMNNRERFGQIEDLNSSFKIDTNMCSPDCCGKQWPVSFDMKKDERITDNELGDKYVPTNMTCTGMRGRGCVCSDKKQFNFLRNRGNNA